MKRFIDIFILILLLISPAMAQSAKTWDIVFDKPLYTAGETVWVAIFRTDSSNYIGKNEVLHFELISPRNQKIVTGKIHLSQRLGHGYFRLPTNLDEGYYRFRAFTLKDLIRGGYYISADIPVYSEWKENLTVYKFEETTGKRNEEDIIQKDKQKRSFNRRDTASYLKLVPDQDGTWQYVFRVQPLEFKNFPSIHSEIKKVSNLIQINSKLKIEDSLYFEGFLAENTEPENGVTSPLISVYSASNKRFYRAKAKDGWFSLKIPYYEGESTLQVFNLNPFQESVNNLKVRSWTINEGYFNSAKPPITKEIADYLIKTQKRRKVEDLFSLTPNQLQFITDSDSSAVPDVIYQMSDYRYIKNLQDFIFEAIPGARVLTQKDGTQTSRLYNPERRATFMDRPWYVVDGYLTSREDIVLKIPFNDIVEIRLYVDTRTIKKYFEYFLWRNGIMEVKTNDIKYVRSLKTDPNYVDFDGFIRGRDFLKSMNRPSDNLTPDFRTSMYWQAGKWNDTGIYFPLSDDTGTFVYSFTGISQQGKVIKREGELEIR